MDTKPLANSLAIKFIKTYQLRVSERLHSHCSLEPSCSNYALKMYGKHGFVKATAKSLVRIYHCARSQEHPATPQTARGKRVKHAAVVVFILGIISSFTASAGAEVTPGCGGSINGQSLAGRSSTSPHHAIPVKQRTAVQVSGQSPTEISRIRIRMEAAGFKWTVRDSPTSGTTWQNVVEVDRYAKYGVGLYKINAESTGAQTCVGSALVNVEGNPLSTAAGIAGATMVAVGTIGMIASAGASASEGSQESYRDPESLERDAYEERKSREPVERDPESVARDAHEARRSQERYEKDFIPEVRGIFKLCAIALLPALLLTGVAMMTVGETPSAPSGPPSRTRVSWKPRISFIGLLSGAMLGLGGMILLQQYAIAFPTRNLALGLLIGGVILVGVVIPSLFRVIAVGRINRRLASKG